MKNNYLSRPQTSKYRNESHIHFGDQSQIKQPGSQCLCAKPKKRPQSYRNLSKLASFMNDASATIENKQKVQYLNAIQNRNQVYEVPKVYFPQKNEQSKQFKAFFQKNNQKMYKPIDQFTQYSDLVQRNSRILRRNQFNSPFKSETFADYKRDSSTWKISSKPSRYYNGHRETTTNFKMANTIATSMYQSIQQKKELKKEKQLFSHKKQKYTKTLNKTCLGFAKEYEQLVDKERSSAQKIPLKNAMNRVLTMESLGKKMSSLTQMYI